MKKLARNPIKHEPLEVFAAVAKQQGLSIKSDSDKLGFLKEFGENLRLSSSNPQQLFGKRTERMFSYVLAGLGSCKLIKQEDTGDVFVNKGEVAVPDYRVVTESDAQYLVEVKNVNQDDLMKPYKVEERYFAKLASYADLNGLPLMFALYYRRINQWVLLSKDAFSSSGRQKTITIGEALAKSEMAIFGDMTLGTDKPLSVSLECDVISRESVDEQTEQKECVVQQFQFNSGDSEIVSKLEQRIAHQLMMYGDWEEAVTVETLGEYGERCLFRHEFTPTDKSFEQGFSLIGSLSSIISNA